MSLLVLRLKGLNSMCAKSQSLTFSLSSQNVKLNSHGVVMGGINPETCIFITPLYKLLSFLYSNFSLSQIESQSHL